MRLWAAALCASAWLIAGGASAATIGDYGSNDSLFRFDITIGTNQAVVGVDDLDQAEDVLSPAYLAAHYPFYSDAQPTRGVFDFRGVELVGRYQSAPGFAAFIVQLPSITQSQATELCDPAASVSFGVCTFVYQGLNRTQAYNAFTDDLDDLDPNSPLVRALFASMSRNSPIDPLAGNPDSLQGSIIRDALDLATDTDSAVELGSTETEPWMIGASYSHISSGRFDGDRFDVRAQRSFRFVEGSRAALKVDLPLHYASVKGASQYNGVLSVGYEVPIRQNWSVEPRVAYGLTYSGDLFSAGEIASGSVTSRYRFDGLGRGYVVMANMAGYTSTVRTGALSDSIDPKIHNWVFRNGAAYEMPLKTQLMGRSSSLRVSYTYTNFTGDKLYLNDFHEVSASIGVRAREGEAKIGAELARFALLGTFGDDYHAVTAQVGFRF